VVETGRAIIVVVVGRGGGGAEGGCVGWYRCSEAAVTDGMVRSIPVDWLCDGQNDCDDVGADDETNCSSGD